MTMPPDAGRDVGVPDMPDVGTPETSVEGGDGASCRCFQSCAAGTCSDDVANGCKFAWYNPLGASQQGPVAESYAFGSGHLWAVQIHIEKGGVLAALGMFITPSDDMNASYYLALYRDAGGGQPGSLVWAPSRAARLLATSTQQIDVPCDPPIAVEGGYYWIAGTWELGIKVDYSGGPARYVYPSWSFAQPPAQFPEPDPGQPPVNLSPIEVYANVLQ